MIPAEPNGPSRIFDVLKPYAGPLLGALGLTIGLTGVGMLSPLLMRRLINDVAGSGRWDILPLVLIGLAAVPILSAVLNVSNGLVLNFVGRSIIGRTRVRIFTHLMRLSLRFYDETPAGTIKERLFGDVATVSSVATGGIITVIADVVAVAFAVTMMVRLSWVLSLVTFGLLPLYVLNYAFFSKRIQSSTALLRSRMDHVSSTLQERLSAHEFVQSYGQEEEETVHFASQARQIMRAAIKGSAYSISFNHLSALANKIGNTLVYCLGCLFFIRGEMGYGDVVAFAAYAAQLLGPVVRLTTVANQIVQIRVSAGRIQEVLGRQPAIRDDPEAEAVEEIRGDIDIEGVSFGYEAGERALEDIRLHIRAGVDLAIVGQQGAGRSTLAMLLFRHFEPERGAIRVDGKDIRTYRLHDYRSRIALVMPEAAVFDASIRENLCYGKPEASEGQMIGISKAIGLHPFVEGLAGGYDTKLGAGGLKLSAGNRQRIGIGRALISRPLVLIMDEATASLDPVSAAEIHAAVAKAMEENTYIMIISRLLLAKEADEIVVLDEGRVVETGTHEDLLGTKDSLYGRQFRSQYPSETDR